ncbi:hypothetical protein SAMN05421790_11273 [Kroppenstedtia eburnea]|uniref:Uncharacterized protein n=1 Tax=Kroppenstedtia eburnea TaxID=714067 RepID=A0A1N7PFY5_9BACL|nr:hypothetical protein SAMN05421790_11273 [Kroppenstedtia eburnea]
MNWLKRLGANIYFIVLIGLALLLFILGGVKVFG